MKVMVTGASGFLGSHLVEKLMQEGHEVRAVVRKTSKVDFLKQLGAEIAVANLENGDGLEQAVDGVDAIVHGAAIVKARSPQEFQDVNVRGTETVLAAARLRGPRLRRFVFVSSLAAHGFADDGRPRRPDEDPRPLTHYGKSKLEAERRVLKAKDDFPVSVLRPPAIYGPRDVEMFAFFRVISRRLMPFIGSPGNRLSLIYAPDCADALYLMLTREHPSGRVYFVEDGRIYTQQEFGDIVQRALGVKALRLRLPSGVVSLAAAGTEWYGRARNKAVMLTRDKLQELRHPHLICASEDIREELGWQPSIQLEEGAAHTVQWYRSAGWL